MLGSRVDVARKHFQPGFGLAELWSVLNPEMLSAKIENDGFSRRFFDDPEFKDIPVESHS
jgi:hypothetical protein